MARERIGEAITRRALNRALLARQMLLSREKRSAVSAVERLVGLQAQQARPPFVGLWSRVEGFQREELQTALMRRKVVRATLMRATLHLMSAKDYVEFRPALQPMLRVGMKSILRKRADDLDIDAIVAAAREALDARPSTFAELRAYLAKRFPEADERAMGYAVRTLLPLVTTPGGEAWGFRGDSSFALAEPWIGKPLRTDEDMRALALRYLKAFGPSSAADMQVWSGLQGVQAALEALRSQLVVFRDERKRELFDAPDAPRPEEHTPAPVRFIAAFDNLVLSHADRSRIVSDAHRPRVVTKNLQVLPTFLVDGFVAGTWTLERAKNTATLTIAPFATLLKGVKKELAEEGEKLARFAEPEADRFEVRFS